MYGLPRDAAVPSRNLASSSLLSTAGAEVMGAVGLVTLRKRRVDEVAEREGQVPPAAPPGAPAP